MRIQCVVTSVTCDGETMTVGLRGRQHADAVWRRDQSQEVRFTASEKTKKAFYIGREVAVTIEPR
jgi:hypothetical protein